MDSGDRRPAALGAIVTAIVNVIRLIFIDLGK